MMNDRDGWRKAFVFVHGRSFSLIGSKGNCLYSCSHTMKALEIGVTKILISGFKECTLVTKERLNDRDSSEKKYPQNVAG